MAMSRKHFTAVAKILAGERALARSTRQGSKPGGSVDIYTAAVLESTRNVALSLADVFAADNPAFDRQRFYEAAGISNPSLSKGEAA